MGVGFRAEARQAPPGDKRREASVSRENASVQPFQSTKSAKDAKFRQRFQSYLPHYSKSITMKETSICGDSGGLCMYLFLPD